MSDKIVSRPISTRHPKFNWPWDEKRIGEAVEVSPKEFMRIVESKRRAAQDEMDRCFHAEKTCFDYGAIIETSIAYCKAHPVSPPTYGEYINRQHHKTDYQGLPKDP